MTKKTGNWLIAFGILALPFLIFLGFLISDVLAPPPLPPLPNPNGYDDFMKAAKMVPSDVWDCDKMNEQQLRELVSADAAALSLVRAGLTNRCQVPLQFTQAYTTNHFKDLAALKRLAQAFVAEGRLDEMANRPEAAAKDYLEDFHLGNESDRGGVVIDELVGIAINDVGMESLQKLADQLNAGASREDAAALEALDAQQQTWDEVLAREQDWSERTFPGIKNDLSRIMMRKGLEKVYQACERKFKAQQLKTRQLVLDLAARAYELDKGKPPASVSDLVPDYLKAIPQDPFTGGNLSLHQTARR
ncbi:MAG TPA: hypothetical protein VMD27_05740 [Candidatus Aquilonibacter sp.]|nr:hypothetical protein [Candidatus Aquilonibacter sp.]